MTALTPDETPKAPAKKPALAEFSALEGFAITLGFVAFFAWVAGIALNKGYGFHAPFVASWLLLSVGLCVVKTAAAEVASVWHTTRVKADITLLAANMAAQQEIQQQASGNLTSLLDSLTKTGDR